MTCFWDAIVSHLNEADFKLLNVTPLSRPPLSNFINALKDKNKLIEHTHWQHNSLSDQEKEEHKAAIEYYDIDKIKHGHLTSTCDSFLLLLCELLHINIEHRYLKNTIYYTNTKKVRKTLKFKSNKGHFSR